jgi:tRNA(Ile)-lysidine synthase
MPSNKKTRNKEVGYKQKKEIAKQNTNEIKFTSNVQPRSLLKYCNLLKSSTIVENSLNKATNFLFNELFINEEASILCAVSGGVDSVVMLDILSNLSMRYDFKLYIAHFNHNLRGKASLEDSHFVKALAKDYGLPFYTSSGDVIKYSAKHSLSIEQGARELRYRFLERLAGNLKVMYVATAHTADDSIETFFINLFRGAGLTGLAGIPPKRNFYKNTVLIRPLLQFTKSELINYAKERSLKWKEDATNAMFHYTRNKIRHELIPVIQKDYNPSIVEVINRTSKLISGADQYILNNINKTIQSVISEKSSGRLSVKISQLRIQEDFIKGEIVLYILNKLLKLKNISVLTIDRVLNLLDNTVGAICEINKDFQVLRDREHLIFSKKIQENRINLEIGSIGEFVTGDYKIMLKEVSLSRVKYNHNPNVEYID